MISVPIPLWILRRVVKRNPWLLSDEGRVRRTLTWGIFRVDCACALSSKNKAILLAEREDKT